MFRRVSGYVSTATTLVLARLSLPSMAVYATEVHPYLPLVQWLVLVASEG